MVGLIANLVTRELRRSENEDKGLPPEHPRASSTDDVEGIISLFHEVMGNNFDLKEFFDEFPKVMSEFERGSIVTYHSTIGLVIRPTTEHIHYPPLMNFQLVVLKDWTK